MKDKVLKEVKEELENCKRFIIKKIETLSEEDLNHPDMKAIDYIHDACHTIMVKRGPIHSMGEVRKLNE